MASDRGASEWADRLVRAVQAEVDQPVEDEELVLKRFTVPYAAELEVAAGVLVTGWVQLCFAQGVVEKSLELALDLDEDWLYVLHREVNKRVRLREQGWHLYSGDWLFMQKAVEAAKKQEEEKASETAL